MRPLEVETIAIPKPLRILGIDDEPAYLRRPGSSSIPRILNGLGIAIVSTSKGLMTGKQAKQLNVGGEVVCYVY